MCNVMMLSYLVPLRDELFMNDVPNYNNRPTTSVGYTLPVPVLGTLSKLCFWGVFFMGEKQVLKKTLNGKKQDEFIK